MQYTIYYDFVYLNEYIAAERGNRYKAAKIKKDATSSIMYMLLGKTKITPPCKITYTWFTKQRNRDIDNMAFASKYINDGLVKAKLLPNDNLNNIVEVTHKFEINKKAGVVVDIEEVIK